MPQQPTFLGVKLSFHILNESDIKAELEWDQKEPDEEVPAHLVNLLAYMRSEEGLATIIDIYKKACKDTKRKDLFRTFSILLKTMAMNQIVENREPMISPMEVLGKRRLS